jgi:O-antigen/teichoic acid export membrane protein
MLKKFIKNIALIIFLNLLIKPFWILGIDRSVQNVLGAEEYGFYYAILNFSFLLNILLDFGITNFNNKNIAQNNHLLRKHLSSIIVLKLMLAVIYLAITLICAFVIRYSVDHIMLLLVCAFNQFLISFILYLRSNLSGLHLFKIDSMISVLDRLIMIMICGILLWGGLPIKFSAKWYIYSQTGAYLVTVIITMLIVFRKAKSKFLKLNWNFPFSVMIIKKSFPFAILVLLMTFYNRIDSVMMERILPDGAVQSGIYASAYRLLDATNMIAFLFAGMLLPIFSKMLKHRESVEALVKLAFTFLFIGAVIIACGCTFYSTELMTLMYKEHIDASANVFGYLMFCFVPISTTYVFGTLLTANGNLKYLNIMAACGMLLNITLNFILIPYLYAMGSAVASLITQFLTSIAQVIIVQRIFKFKVNYKFLGVLLLFVIGVVLINYGSKLLHYNWMINFIIMTVACFVYANFIRLLNIRAILDIVKNG